MFTSRGAERRRRATVRAAAIVASLMMTLSGFAARPALAQYDQQSMGEQNMGDMGGSMESCLDNGSSNCTDTCCCAQPDCQQCSPPWMHRSGVWGEFLYLHPTDADVAHAQQQNGTGGAGTVPFGLVDTADPGYEPGFRVGAALRLSQCSSLTMAYTFFESQEATDVAPPIIPGGGGAIGSLVQHPGAAILASAGPVHANYDIDFQLAEFAYRHLWCGNNRGWVNYSVGARYAHLEQEFLQTGLFSGSQAGAISTGSHINFDGGGLLFGLDGERRIGCGGISVYGNGNISPVSGQFRTSYRMNNDTTDVLLADVRWKDDRVVTILNYEAGVAWTSCCNTFRVSAGYMFQHWFNAVTTPSYIDAVQANNYVDVGDTLSFDGLVARAEVRF